MSFPEKVYKYRDWQNGFHRNILLYNELYFASPKDFNDPFDCRIAPNYKTLSELNIDKYVDALVAKNYNVLINKGNDISKIKEQFKKRAKNPKALQKSYENLLFDYQNKYYGILSLSSKWNSILMWSHYANCHKGFCIGFWTEQLIKETDVDRAGIVEYKSDYPYLEPTVISDKNKIIEKAVIQTQTKSKDWIAEDEFRLLNLYYPKIPMPFERIVNFSNDVIAELVLGINISENDKREIVKLCRQKDINVFQAIKKDSLFEIDRTIIEI